MQRPLGWAFAAFPTAIGFALIGVVVGEFFGGAQGLGYIITVALGQLETSVMSGTSRIGGTPCLPEPARERGSLSL